VFEGNAAGDHFKVFVNEILVWLGALTDTAAVWPHGHFDALLELLR